MADKNPVRDTPQPEELERLAGEYVIGVLSADERLEFEALAASVTDAAEARTRWENRLTGLNSEYGTLSAPDSVKARVDQRLFASAATTATSAQKGTEPKGGLWNALGFWRGLGVVGSAAAVALGVYSARLNDDLTDSRSQLTAALEEKQESESQLQAFESEIASRGEQLADLEAQIAEREGQVASLEAGFAAASERAAQLEADLAENRETVSALEAELAESRDAVGDLEMRLAENSERFGALEAQLANARLEIAESEALLVQARADLEDVLNREPALQVVSLESPDTDYRFLAVHEQGTDKVRMTALSGEIAPDQDYELWLVEPEKQTVSLGVVPAGKTAVDLTDDQVAVLEAGGLLAISVEQKGGSPTGVAQGPVVALGAPNEL